MQNLGLKAIYNQVNLLLKITPVTPFLIKSGETLDPTKPDMEFIRLKTSFVPQGVVYIPGSSIKGVIRSCAERILRTSNLDVCNIVEEKIEEEDKSCSAFYRQYINVIKEKRERQNYLESITLRPLKKYLSSIVNIPEPPEKLFYSGHCYACRTFGSTNIASRVFFTDIFPWGFGISEQEKKKIATEIENKYIQIRPGVSIDRRKGSVKHGPFELEIITGGNFYGEVLIKNYQLWQLSLLFLAFSEIDEGFQKIGYGKTRGLGKVNLKVEELKIEQFGMLKNDSKIRGIGYIKDLIKKYDLLEEDEILLDGIKSEPLTFSSQFILKEEKVITKFKEEALKIFSKLVEEKGKEDER
ncbi:MAG: RAMP superfamily CRISPR-associated protein [Acidobacteriota bacterium]